MQEKKDLQEKKNIGIINMMLGSKGELTDVEEKLHKVDLFLMIWGGSKFLFSPMKISCSSNIKRTRVSKFIGSARIRFRAH